MKWFFLIFFFVLSLFSICALFYIFPYYAYIEIINERSFQTLYNLGKPPSKFLNGQTLQLQDNNNYFKNDGRPFLNFHIGDYLYPLPSDHPLLLLVPVIKKDEKSKKIKTGILLKGQDQKDLLEFLPQQPSIFERKLRGQNIFRIPVYREFLAKKSLDELWEDLFTMEIPSFPILSKDNFKKIQGFSHEELVYFLYIIYLRSQFFSDFQRDFAYYEDLELGVLKSKVQGQKSFNEKYFFLIDNKIESFSISIGEESNLTLSLRNKIIKEFEFIPSFSKKAEIIYQDFRELPYHLKKQQMGMLYLFSAWSHQIENVEFLREIISFLEKGEGNLVHLRPLYVYAFEKYGNEFTSKRKVSVDHQDEDPILEVQENGSSEYNLETKEDSSLTPFENQRLPSSNGDGQQREEEIQDNSLILE